MHFEGLFPIGTVVLLKESTKRVMIVGVCQRGADNPGSLYDYTGVPFPEGYLSGDKMFMFNNDQIHQVFAIGYQDAEQLAFKTKVDALIADLRSQN